MPIDYPPSGNNLHCINKKPKFKKNGSQASLILNASCVGTIITHPFSLKGQRIRAKDTIFFPSEIN
jgi:hypothetical protein